MAIHKSVVLAAALLSYSPFASATSAAEFAKRASSSSSNAIPPSFSPSATTQLQVAWQGQTVTPGEHLNINVPKLQPQIGLDSLPAGSSSSSLFTIIMIDPDAPTPQNPSEAQILHWLQPSSRASTNSSSTSSGASIAPITFAATTAAAQAAYIPPAPPAGSAAHRYIQYLFAQPAGFQVPADFAGFGGNNRTNFDIVRFVRESGLQGPLAANYVLVAPAGNASSNGTGSGSGSQGNSTGSPQPFKGEAVGVTGASRWGFVALLGGLLVVYGF